MFSVALVQKWVSLSGNTINTLNHSHIHVGHYVHKQGEIPCLAKKKKKSCSHLISTGFHLVMLQ